MEVTISTHNGSKVARDHNLRKPWYVKAQEHIDPSGIHETWHDETLSHAYERLFGDAVREYNNSQARADRRISNYLKQVQDNSKKHTVYEMIVGVYGPVEGAQLDPAKGKAILREFTDSWQKRNPNLALIGAYYHADEEGEPHVHIDYVPVAHGYERGPKTQTGLVKALGEMGFTKHGRETAQIAWERRENDYLESLCAREGLKVMHPQRHGEKVAHLHTEVYKAKRERDRAVTQTQELDTHIKRETERLAKQVKQAQKATELALQSSMLKKHRDGSVTVSKEKFDSVLDAIMDINDLAKEVRRSPQDVQSEYALAKQQHEEAMRLRKEAEQARREAQRERAVARQEHREADNLIWQRAFDEVRKALHKALSHSTDRDVNARMREHMQSVRYEDGSTVWDSFQEREAELERELLTQAEQALQEQERQDDEIAPPDTQKRDDLGFSR